ncbi:MAG: 1,4-beta-xylanase, partial [Alphaproteobacteria bacterium]
MSDPRWSIEKITDWHNSLPWLRGCNYIPANAINEIEMWAAKTFDPATLDRELGWAAGLGFNVMRVYLHDQVWADDAEGFKKRIDEYLTISDKHGIKTFFVLFDDCWHEPELGVPAPRPGIHNSGWLRSPGRAKLLDEGTWGTLEAYVRDIVTTFKNDPRIVAWDIYNEVTNLFLPSSSLPEDEKKKALETVMAERAVQGPAALKLMELAFGWVRDCDVSQPLTAGIYYDDPEMNPKLIALSDFVSFHHYKEP